MFKLPKRNRLLSLLVVPLLVASVLFLQPPQTQVSAHSEQQTNCSLIHATGATQVFVCPRNTRPVPGARPLYTFPDQTQLYIVVGAQPTATRTQPPATATRTQPTATRPSATQPPATPSTGPIAPYPSAPACPTHDSRAYHGLWDAARGCHYDHHHGDNPHDADSVFGTDVYGLMGGEISYPWQTMGTDGASPENEYKHAGYFWHVRTDIPCEGSAPCLRAFRTLVHQHASGRDATVQFHSYVFEGITSDGGYLLMGGWLDFGDLHVPEGTVIVDTPHNHDSNACNGAGRHKQHGAAGSAGQIIWYGASLVHTDRCAPRGIMTISVSVHDVWDWTNPADPANFTDYVCYGAPRCRHNATSLRPHLIAFQVPNDWGALVDPDRDGRATWSGNADRYGRLLPGPCQQISLDCAPVIMRNVAVGQNYKAADSHTARSLRDYDIYFNGQTSGWSQPVP